MRPSLSLKNIHCRFFFPTLLQKMIVAWALATALIVYAIAEAIWLTSMRAVYARWFANFALGPLEVRSVAAAALAYVALIAGFVTLVVLPDSRGVVLRGALFGLAVYGVYNFTNMATLKGYPWAMVAVDTLWGTAIFAAVALVYSLLVPKSA
jgi:uncharacterized membrane protein